MEESVETPQKPQAESLEAKQINFRRMVHPFRQGPVTPEEAEEFDRARAPDHVIRDRVKIREEENRTGAAWQHKTDQEGDKIPRDRMPGISPEMQAEIDKTQAKLRRAIGPGYLIPDVTPAQIEEVRLNRKRSNLRDEDDQRVTEAKRKIYNEFIGSDAYKDYIGYDRDALERLKTAGKKSTQKTGGFSDEPSGMPSSITNSKTKRFQEISILSNIHK